MNPRDNIFNGTKIKKDGKLIYSNPGVQAMYDEFVNSLAEGQEVEEFLEANKDNGTNAQLAKIHVYIRKLATELGYTFKEMKLLIKHQAGLAYEDNIKSFAKCSKEELGLVLEQIKEVCDIAGIQYD